MRVLLIEDHVGTSVAVELMLKSQGFNVYTTDLGEEGVDLARLYDYDCILLDINLPDILGWEVLKRIRVDGVVTPVIIVSGLAAIEDKVRGLGLGADDYMTKPFHKDELVARIHAVVRRSKGHAQSQIQAGNTVVNLDTQVVTVGGKRIALTGKEYQMLETLWMHKGTVVTKESFLNNLYGGMDEPDIKIVDVFICKLRRKLSEYGCAGFDITTEWGRGFMLREGEGEAITYRGAPTPVSSETASAIVLSYQQGDTVSQSADACGVTRSVARTVLKNAGVLVRRRR